MGLQHSQKLREKLNDIYEQKFSLGDTYILYKNMNVITFNSNTHNRLYMLQSVSEVCPTPTLHSRSAQLRQAVGERTNKGAHQAAGNEAHSVCQGGLHISAYLF
jgi:hypothetical protein